MNVTLFPVTLNSSPPDSFIYVSDAHGSRSWLDHVLCTHSSHSSVSDMVINYDCVSLDHFPVSFTIYVKFYPPLKRPLRNKLVNPVLCGTVPPPKTFSTITPKLVLFHLAMMYHKLLYVVPTLTVMMKPVSYYCANVILILLILLRVLPMSFLLKFIIRFQNTLFLVGATWSGTPIRLLENLTSSGGLLGAPHMVLCMIS